MKDLELKTKLFKGESRGTFLDRIREYQEFVKDNQDITIVSVNTFDFGYILLTYKQ